MVSNEISGGSFGANVQAGTIHGGVHVHHQPSAPVVPRQLPIVSAHFTNRVAEIQLLDEELARRRDGAPALVLLSGPGGAGKTALASYWGSRASESFPDGQLYADLGGFRAEQPVAPGQVLEGFLRALGVMPEQVPVDLAEQVALFRSLTAELRLLVLLDNVISAAQVTLLLPGSADGMVLVISRWRLGGVLAQGGGLVEVAALSQDHAVELLTRSAGRVRGDVEGQQVRELARLCGRLPIALCVAGARLASRPRWPVGRVVRELADEQRRLTALSVDGEVSVMSVFDVSYEGLSGQQARAYRWLALQPGPDFGIEAAAAAMELSIQETSEVLETLVDASVLEDSEIDRYRFHDLIRLHARRRAETEDSERERDAVLARVTEYYLSVAVTADRVVMPLEWHVGPVYERDSDAATVYATSLEALDSLESELPNLMAVLRAAAQRRLDQLVWQLCEAMWSLFLYRKHFQDWIAAYRLGIEAAGRCGDQAAASRMRHRLGIAFHNLSRPEEALWEGRAALTAARAAGHELAESAALQLMGMALRNLGRFDEAIEALRQAVELDRRTGQVRSEALAQRVLGQTLYAAGQTVQAVDELERACELAAGLSDPPVEAMSRVCLAEALTRADRASEALALARAAWDVMEGSGSHQYKARVMMAWGEAAEGIGDLTTARDRLLRAHTFFTEAGVPDLRPVQHALSRVEACLETQRPENDEGQATR
ncbi:tetratricopeptide repeat protein [Actinoallomurus sp. NBC_01490]|uniref:tetratricopeptide repeat protein n=1 Tax=Actinoallomurus sp. NBC_01490 TaxID=2903557 RepID=UPI002E2FE556|nr:tetratricopeptide repeat protein [Actinoallomurus sp. NBC_01490]